MRWDWNQIAAIFWGKMAAINKASGLPNKNRDYHLETFQALGNWFHDQAIDLGI
jgi:hypothetical protein